MWFLFFFVFKATVQRAGHPAGVAGEGVESQQAPIHGERGAAVEAAQRGPVQLRQVPYIPCHPLPVTAQFRLLPQPQRVAQMTLLQAGD